MLIAYMQKNGELPNLQDTSGDDECKHQIQTGYTGNAKLENSINNLIDVQNVSFKENCQPIGSATVSEILYGFLKFYGYDFNE
jgi:hypothetical protein